MKNMPKKSIEDKWESRELGASEKYARKVSSKREKAVDSKLGLQIISIRLQKNLIDELKRLAAAEGLGYQPYIRRILTQYARGLKRKEEQRLKIMRDDRT